MEQENKPDKDEQLNRLYLILTIGLLSLAVVGMILFFAMGGVSYLGGE